MANARRASVENTHCVLNTVEVQTAQFTLDNTQIISATNIVDELTQAFGEQNLARINATAVCEKLFGDAIAANLFIVGYAYQLGLIPIGESAIFGAIELNGIDVDMNQRAFQWGRVAVVNRSAIDDIASPNTSSALVDVDHLSLDEYIERFKSELSLYQSPRYGAVYEAKVTHLREVLGADEPVLKGYAAGLYKLMAYRDEYEVARLHSSPEFRSQLAEQFAGDFKLKYHLAPPLLSRTGPNGRLEKIEFGSWMRLGFAALAKFRFLRGTRFDPFGYFQERKTERALLDEYESLIKHLITNYEGLSPTQRLWMVRLPDQIKGYGSVKEQNIALFRQALTEAMALPQAQIAGLAA
jgi:indolepyruvate ferredoxin oxidoreductase